MYECSVCMCARMPQEGIRSPYGWCESLVQSPWKNSQCSYPLSHLSNLALEPEGLSSDFSFSPSSWSRAYLSSNSVGFFFHL